MVKAYGLGGISSLDVASIVNKITMGIKFGLNQMSLKRYIYNYNMTVSCHP